MLHRSFDSIIRQDLGYTGKISQVEHHFAHAASSFLTSPFEQSAILTIDGTGEWVTTWMGVGKGTRIRKLRSIPYPHSLGKLYETVTQFLGFKANHGEGKVMGLASFGEPAYSDVFEKIIRFTENGEFLLNMDWFRYHVGHPVRYSKRFEKYFGSPRTPGSELTKRDMDLAATLQKTLEKASIHLSRNLRRISGMKHLCLAGGVALNSQMNYKLMEESGFDKIYIFPAANDPGTSVGAALHEYYQTSGSDERHELESAFLGDRFSEEQMEAAFRKVKVSCARESDPPSKCAELLAAGKVVGWFQGRMEFGPRALGNRSILADPRIAGMKDLINEKVKHRETFRPFAPSILEEECGRFFVSDVPSPYMLRVYPVRPEYEDIIPAVIHVDGTCRVQTVSADKNEYYYRLIKAFGELTNVPVVLNTSLNIKGEPIVRTPDEAVDSFLRNEMDALFVGPFLTEKPV